jgi:hypothetical protein
MLRFLTVRYGPSSRLDLLVGESAVMTDSASSVVSALVLFSMAFAFVFPSVALPVVHAEMAAPEHYRPFEALAHFVSSEGRYV